VLKRYAVASGAILVVAVIIAAIVYKVQSTTYSGTCVIEVSLPPTEQKLGSDFFAFNGKLAQDAVSETIGTVVFQDVARLNGLTVDDLTRKTVVSGAGLSGVSISVSDSDRTRAVNLANAVCNKLVSSVRDRLQARRQNSASLTAARIAQVLGERDAIAAIPATDRTPAEQATLLADSTALATLQQELASTVGLQPELVDIIGSAAAGVSSSPDFTRDLVIAIVAGVLASLLMILVSEIVVERRW